LASYRGESCGCRATSLRPRGRDVPGIVSIPPKVDLINI
jgi:hypothetical protein